MDNSVYNSLVKRAAGMLRRFASLDIAPEDLVAGTFIRFGNISEDEFAKKMWVAAGGLTQNRYDKPEGRFYDERVCRLCKEQKPAACFRTWYLRGYLIHDSWCRPCKNKYSNEYKKKKRRLQKEAKKSIRENSLMASIIFLFITHPL